MKLDRRIIDSFPTDKERDDIFVKTLDEDSLVRVRCAEIEWIGVEGGKTAFHFKSGETLLVGTDFNTLCQKLPQETFVRTGGTEMVNIHQANSIIGNTLLTGSYYAAVEERYRESAQRRKKRKNILLNKI